MNKTTDSVRIALFDPSDQSHFLVLAEADDPDNWKLPGGKFDTVDETPDVAAGRELEEELGLSAEMVGLINAGELTNDDGVSARYIYVGTIEDQAVQPTLEVSEKRWVTQESIPNGRNRDHILSAVKLAQSALKA